MAKALGLGDEETNTVLPDLVVDPPANADTLLLTMLTSLTGVLCCHHVLHTPALDVHNQMPRTPCRP